MRIQLDFDDQGVATLNRLKFLTGLKTHKDLFNNALTLLHWAIEQLAQGRLVASVDEGHENYRELQMPALQHAASLMLQEKRQATQSVDPRDYKPWHVY